MVHSSKPAMEYRRRRSPVWSQQSQILSHGLGAQAPESLYLWQEHIELARPNLTNLNSDINMLYSTTTALHMVQHYPHKPKIIWKYQYLSSFSVSLILSEVLLYAVFKGRLAYHLWPLAKL